MKILKLVFTHYLNRKKESPSGSFLRGIYLHIPMVRFRGILGEDFKGGGWGGGGERILITDF